MCSFSRLNIGGSLITNECISDMSGFVVLLLPSILILVENWVQHQISIHLLTSQFSYLVPFIFSISWTKTKAHWDSEWNKIAHNCALVLRYNVRCVSLNTNKLLKPQLQEYIIAFSQIECSKANGSRRCTQPWDDNKRMKQRTVYIKFISKKLVHQTMLKPNICYKCQWISFETSFSKHFH